MATKVILVTNRKGGVGKTTCASNLLTALGGMVGPDKRVLGIDLDPQGNLSRALGVESGDRCIGDYLVGDKEMAEVAMCADRSSSGGPERPNVWIIPSTVRLAEQQKKITTILALSAAGIESDLPYAHIDDVLLNTVAPYFTHFEYVIIDSPPTIGWLSNATYKIADWVVVPVRMAYLDAIGAAQNLADVTAARKKGWNVKIGAIVPTFYRSNELVAQAQLASFARHYPAATITAPIPRAAVIEKSQADGQRSLFEYPPAYGTPAAEAMMDLVHHVRALGGPA